MRKNVLFRNADRESKIEACGMKAFQERAPISAKWVFYRIVHQLFENRMVCVCVCTVPRSWSMFLRFSTVSRKVATSRSKSCRERPAMLNQCLKKKLFRSPIALEGPFFTLREFYLVCIVVDVKSVQNCENFYDDYF